MTEQERLERFWGRGPRSNLICPICKVSKPLEKYVYQYCEDCMAPCIFCGFKMFPRQDGKPSVCNFCWVSVHV